MVKNSNEKNIKFDEENKSSNKNNFESFCSSFVKSLNVDKAIHFFDKYSSQDMISILEDKEFLSSINSFFENNLSLSETSKASFLHKNTILYRINKIQKLTGLNLRDFNDAFIFKILILIYEMKK